MTAFRTIRDINSGRYKEPLEIHSQLYSHAAKKYGVFRGVEKTPDIPVGPGDSTSFHALQGFAVDDLATGRRVRLVYLTKIYLAVARKVRIAGSSCCR